jgi:hypothetical protein
MLQEQVTIIEFIRAIHELGTDELPNYENLFNILKNCLLSEGLEHNPFFSFQPESKP